MSSCFVIHRTCSNKNLTPHLCYSYRNPHQTTRDVRACLSTSLIFYQCFFKGIPDCRDTHHPNLSDLSFSSSKMKICSQWNTSRFRLWNLTTTIVLRSHTLQKTKRYQTIYRIDWAKACDQRHWRRGVVVITTGQLRSIKPGLRFCAGSNPARGMWQ